jgi:hypothetical protein
MSPNHAIIRKLRLDPSPGRCPTEALHRERWPTMTTFKLRRGSRRILHVVMWPFRAVSHFKELV